MLRLKLTAQGEDELMMPGEQIMPVSRKEALTAGIHPRAYGTVHLLRLLKADDPSADKMFALFQALTLQVSLACALSRARALSFFLSLSLSRSLALALCVCVCVCLSVSHLSLACLPTRSLPHARALSRI
jgi:hypothetical protein